MNPIQFEDFLKIITPLEKELAGKINDLYLTNECKCDIKESASGYTLSYISLITKKTVANFVCRKTGLKIRLTPPKPFECDELISNFPLNMKNDMIKAHDCLRLQGEDVCNLRCLMGYPFTLNNEKYSKCRSMAFLFSVTEENFEHLIALSKKSLQN